LGFLLLDKSAKAKILLLKLINLFQKQLSKNQQYQLTQPLFHSKQLNLEPVTKKSNSKASTQKIFQWFLIEVNITPKISHKKRV